MEEFVSQTLDPGVDTWKVTMLRLYLYLNYIDDSRLVPKVTVPIYIATNNIILELKILKLKKEKN